MSEIGGDPAGAWDDGAGDDAAAVETAARWLRGHHAGGVAVVTTVAGGVYWGSTVSGWLVASIDPFQLLVSIEAENQTAEWIETSRLFGLSVLPWTEQFLADQFAGRTPRPAARFETIDHRIGGSGVPIFGRSIAWAECSLEGTVATGDHMCLLGTVSASGSGDGDPLDPLVYYLRRYRRLR